MINLIEANPELLIKLVNERILFEQKIADNVCDHPFFEMLIFHKEQAAREMCELILTKVTSSLFELLEFRSAQHMSEDQLAIYQTILERIIDAAVSVIPNKITNAWHKLGSFFNFFHNLIKDLKMSRLIMFRQVRLVSKLVDLVVKIKDHFGNGYNYGSPPIEFAVKTLCLMIRAQPMVIWLYKMPLQSQVSVEEYEYIISQS